ncbi:hypothetical protein ES703_112264 [subsurface metagenome]
MGQEISFAAPGTEEMTRIVTIGAGAGITGAVQGVIVKVAPQLGALEPLFTWGTLIGIPAVGAAGALFTRGILSNLMLGIAAGGLGVVGYSLPELMAPITGRRASGQLNAGPGIKLLGQGGALAAPQRAQQRAGVGIEF